MLLIKKVKLINEHKKESKMFTRAALKSYFIQIEYEPFKLSKQCGAQFK